MTLSEQLGKLAARAKQAEARATAAKSKARKDLEGDVAAARDTAQAEAGRLRENVGAGGGDVSDRRRRVQQTWSDYIGAVHRTMEDATAEVDLAQSRHAADSAESDASYAIEYAYAAIEQAEYAVLHAEFARMKADDLEAGTHTTA